MLKDSEELEKRINPVTRQPSKTNKESIEEFVKNAKELCDIRYEIIYIIEKAKNKKPAKELDLDWSSKLENDLTKLIETTDFEDLKKDQQLIGAVKSLKSFLADIMDKKINNIEDAKKISQKSY